MRQCRSDQENICALPVETPPPWQKVADLVKMRFLFFGQAIKIGLLKGLVLQSEHDSTFFGHPALTPGCPNAWLLRG
jgi:hypothetical protein